MTRKPSATNSWLRIYLQDHYAGATAGLSLFARVASSHSDPGVRAEVSELAAQIATDRDALADLMRRLEVRPARTKMVAGWLVEKGGRLKSNGRLLRRSPLSDVIDLEMLLLGVRGKGHGWLCLREAAEHDPRIEPTELEDLIRRAEGQAARLEQMHRASARSTFG